jgi:large subunit ribosomal protein L6
MSRIGKLPIKIPNDVSIFKIIHNIGSNYYELVVKGKCGILQTSIPNIIKIDKEKKILKINLKDTARNGKALHGLYRTLINNMVTGVSKQFELTLILKGVGYRVRIEDQEIILNLGYSHPVKILIPKLIMVSIVQNNIIHLKSCDKELLGLFASNIRSWRCPEPYKGKGILYKDEQIIYKAGKSGK